MSKKYGKDNDSEVLAECYALDAAYAAAEEFHTHEFERLNPGTCDLDAICPCGLLLQADDHDGYEFDPIRDGWVGKDGRP